MAGEQTPGKGIQVREYNYEYLREEIKANSVWSYDQKIERGAGYTTRALPQGEIFWDKAGGKVAFTIPWIMKSTPHGVYYDGTTKFGTT